MIVKKKGVKKGHILLSVCQIRVNRECILGFWAAPDVVVASDFPNSEPVGRYSCSVSTTFDLAVAEEEGVRVLFPVSCGCSWGVN